MGHTPRLPHQMRSRTADALRRTAVRRGDLGRGGSTTREPLLGWGADRSPCGSDDETRCLEEGSREPRGGAVREGWLRGKEGLVADGRSSRRWMPLLDRRHRGPGNVVLHFDLPRPELHLLSLGLGLPLRLLSIVDPGGVSILCIRVIEGWREGMVGGGCWTGLRRRGGAGG